MVIDPTLEQPIARDNENIATKEDHPKEKKVDIDLEEVIQEFVVEAKGV